MVALRQDVLPLFDDLAFFHVHSHTGHQHATGNTHADSLARSHSARADPAAAGYLLCARHVPQWVPLGAAPAGDAMNDGGNVAGIAPAAAWSWLSSLSTADLVCRVPPAIPLLTERPGSPPLLHRLWRWCMAPGPAGQIRTSNPIIGVPNCLAVLAPP
eukprot:SAG31_NODE_499_length_14841_cov_7.930471_20_plen_157_part_01